MVDLSRSCHSVVLVHNADEACYLVVDTAFPGLGWGDLSLALQCTIFNVYNSGEDKFCRIHLVLKQNH